MKMETCHMADHYRERERERERRGGQCIPHIVGHLFRCHALGRKLHITLDILTKLLRK